MSRRSCRRGPGSSRPVRGARLTPLTPTRLRWSGTRMAGLRPVVNDEQLAVLRVLVDRRRSLGEDHTRMIAQLQQLLLELIPGGAKKDLSAAQAKALLAKVRPRDIAGKTRRRVAAEVISDLERIYQRKKAANKESTELLAATGTTLTELPGIGPFGCGQAARGGRRHHPLSRSRSLRIMEREGADRCFIRRPGSSSSLARGQSPDQTESSTSWRPSSCATPPKGGPTTPAQSRRQDLDGSHARLEATAVKHRLQDDGRRRDHPRHRQLEDGPGRATGQRGNGATTHSSAAGSQRHTNSSDKPLPGPASTNPRTPLPAAS